MLSITNFATPNTWTTNHNFGKKWKNIARNIKHIGGKCENFPLFWKLYSRQKLYKFEFKNNLIVCWYKHIARIFCEKRKILEKWKEISFGQHIFFCGSLAFFLWHCQSWTSIKLKVTFWFPMRMWHQQMKIIFLARL